MRKKTELLKQSSTALFVQMCTESFCNHKRVHRALELAILDMIDTNFLSSFYVREVWRRVL